MKWAKVSCILHNIKLAEKSESEPPGGFGQTGYDRKFFQEYEEEYAEIEALHERISNTVALYKELEQSKEEDGRERFQALKESLEQDVDDLLERVYTFIACAVRSKQSTESEVYATLGQLGFSLPSAREKPIDLNALITFLGSTGILIILVVLAGSYIFPHMIAPEILAFTYYMKGGAVIAIVWALSAICCHGSSTLVALSYRKNQIAKDKWKVPNGNGRRPLRNYLVSSIAGGVVGFLFLMMIVFIYIASNEVTRFDDFQISIDLMLKSAIQNLIWIVAIGCTGWFAVHHYDSYYEESSSINYWSKALLQAAVIAVVGFICAMTYTEIWHYHNHHPFLGPDDFMKVRFVFSLFVAGVVALMGAVMGYWFTKSNYRSMFRTIRIDCRHAGIHLPAGADICENGNRIGGNGEWISLFRRRHTLTVKSEELGEAGISKSFILDIGKNQSEIYEVAIEPV